MTRAAAAYIAFQSKRSHPFLYVSLEIQYAALAGTFLSSSLMRCLRSQSTQSLSLSHDPTCALYTRNSRARPDDAVTKIGVSNASRTPHPFATLATEAATATATDAERAHADHLHARRSHPSTPFDTEAKFGGAPRVAESPHGRVHARRGRSQLSRAALLTFDGSTAAEEENARAGWARTGK